MLNINSFKNDSENNIIPLQNYSDFNFNKDTLFIKEDLIPNKQKKKPLFISKKEEEKGSNLNKDNKFLQKKHYSKENNILKKNLNGRWSLEEQMLFVDAALEFGSNWKKIQEKFSTRTITQIRSHAQKFLMKLKVNAYLKEKGLEYDFCWSKAITYLKSVLSDDEIKNIFYSLCVENKKRNIKENLFIDKYNMKNDEYIKKGKDNIQYLNSYKNNNSNIDENNFIEKFNNNNLDFGELFSEPEKDYDNFEKKLYFVEEKEEQINYCKNQQKYIPKILENFNFSYLNEVKYNPALYYNNEDNDSFIDSLNQKENFNYQNNIYLLE